LAPRVTVAIPTFNRAAMLPEAIESVLAQTYGDFHLLVADNASTDETAEVVGSYEDRRLEYVRRPENLGLLGNFADVLSRLDTEYSLILCDDDLLRPTFLEETVGVLDAHPRAGMVHTAFSIIDARGDVVEADTDWTYGLTRDTVEPSADFVAESMKWGCRVCSSAALMRTEAIPAGGFEAADFPAIDFGLWLRMALDWDTAFVARPLAAYRIHGESQSADLGVPHDAGYQTGLEWIDHRAAVKDRFLGEHGTRLRDETALRPLVRRARRYELTAMVRKASLPQRRFLPTVRALAAAIRADPRVAVDRAALQLLAASILGRRAVENLRRGRSAPPSQRSGA
jgi:glycosyltransferase involved in cell wall biosynthesis